MMWSLACASLVLGAFADVEDVETLQLLQLAAARVNISSNWGQPNLALGELNYGAEGTLDYFLDGRGVTGENKRVPARGAPKVGHLQNLQWLHVPKSGTSFMATIWAYACGQGERPIDMSVDVKFSPLCQACYDFALMDRYPKSMYCNNSVLASLFQTQHKPVTASTLAATEVIGLFRRPSQRIISAAKAMHLSGFSSSSMKALHDSCRAYGGGDGGFYSCFAKSKGVAGCLTRMLTGGHCAEDPALNTGKFDGAVSRVADAKLAMNQMAFVGLTDRWDESVCLFHLMFGGSAYTAEFKDIHASTNHSDDYDEALLQGFKDEADEQLYSHAVQLFEAQLRRYVPKGQRACDLVLDSKAVAAAPVIDCEKRGAQCGEEQGFDCGVCPQQRMEFCVGTGDVGEVECTANKCGKNREGMEALFHWKDFVDEC